MTSTADHQKDLLARFASALEGRHDHVVVSHSELSAAWPGNPDGKSSLKQLIEATGDGWVTDHRSANGDYVFSRNPSRSDD